MSLRSEGFATLGERGRGGGAVGAGALRASTTGENGGEGLDAAEEKRLETFVRREVMPEHAGEGGHTGACYTDSHLGDGEHENWKQMPSEVVVVYVPKDHLVVDTQYTRDANPPQYSQNRELS